MYFAAVAKGIYTSSLIILLLHYRVTNCHNLSDLTQIIFVSHQGYVPLEALGVEIFLLFLVSIFFPIAIFAAPFGLEMVFLSHYR